MLISSNTSLKVFNTFNIEASTKYFTELNSISDIHELMLSNEFKKNDNLILGGGSNVLFTKDFNGLVIKNAIKGIEIIKEDDDLVLVKCYAGENWHEFVTWCINKNYGGLENLSLIPGCTGASPMQNIGAYGVEIKDIFFDLEAINLFTGELTVFNKTDCQFGYRESVFKKQLKNQYLITSVTFQLTKKPVFNIEYGAIKQELDKMNIKELSIKAISDAVISIRSSKLPNPKIIGNAGSFFKNPEVSVETYNRLKSEFPNIVAYPLDNSNYKLAAGWLIEQSGLKGMRIGDAGVHNLQALVLVNYGNAKGNDIFNLSTEVLEKVKDKFDVDLEREVNII
jgi:UDP-N-acetylmuramate dehydrogenase